MCFQIEKENKIKSFNIVETHKLQKLYISFIIKPTKQKKYQFSTSVYCTCCFSSKLFLFFCAPFNASPISAAFYPV